MNKYTEALVHRMKHDENLKFIVLKNGAVKILSNPKPLDKVSAKAYKKIVKCGSFEGQAKFGHVCHSFKGEGLKGIN